MTAPNLRRRRNPPLPSSRLFYFQPPKMHLGKKGKGNQFDSLPPPFHPFCPSLQNDERSIMGLSSGQLKQKKGENATATTTLRGRETKTTNFPAVLPPRYILHSLRLLCFLFPSVSNRGESGATAERERSIIERNEATPALQFKKLFLLQNSLSSFPSFRFREKGFLLARARKKEKRRSIFTFL